MPAANGHDLQAHAGRVEALLDELRDLPDPTAGERAEELVRALVAMYGVGIERILLLLGEHDTGVGVPVDGGPPLVRMLAEDEVVSRLLVLHDLHPDDTDTRIQRALDGVRPYLGSHAGGIHYDGVDEEGVAHLRLEGSCDGCPSSQVTVKLTVERVILEAAPEVQSIDVVGMVSEGPTLLQIQPRPPSLDDPVTATDGADGAAGAEEEWLPLPLTAAPGSMAPVDLHGMSLLVANLGGTPYAYRDGCPRCATPVSEGALDDAVLTCRGCGARYDVRLAGRGLDAGGGHLDPVPVLPDGTGWKVALPGGVTA